MPMAYKSPADLEDERNALHELARRLFEAYEGERCVRGGRGRRWSQLTITQQDCWIAAARAVAAGISGILRP